MSQPLGQTAPLTGHLRQSHGPVSLFLANLISPTATQALRQPGELPAVTTSLAPWELGLIGTALDYRIRFSLGTAQISDLIAARSVSSLCGMPYDPRSPAPSRALSSWLGSDSPERQVGEAGWRFLTETDAALTRISPVGWARAGSAEAELLRRCLVLACLDPIYRAGVPPQIFLQPRVCQTPEALMAAIRPSWLADLGDLTLLYLPSAEAQGWFQTRSRHLNPTFSGSRDVAADADLILDHTLIDIKTVTQPRRILTETLRQLLGYTLLDYDDRFEIRSVGIYLGRHGRLLSWSLEELFGHAVTPDELAAHRRDFASLLRRPVSLVSRVVARPGLQ